jgi:tetratricopeptide (TPR) repeat protein
LSSQLASRYPDFLRALEQTSTDGIGPIVVRQSIQGNVSGGSVTGVEIHVGGLSGEAAFNRLVRIPLRSLAADKGGGPVVILVDSLDAAAQYARSIHEPGIGDLLGDCDDLPGHIRFVLTCRPQERILRPFRRAGCMELSLDSGASLRLAAEDLGVYVQQGLSRIGIGGRLAPGLDRSAVLDHIVEAAAGNFLVARHVVEGLGGRKTITAEDLRRVPASLKDFYAQYLERVTTTTAWDSLASLFGALAVAQQPLVESDLAGALGRPASEIRRLLGLVRDLLDTDESKPPAARQYSLFHGSFGEFLLDRENADFWCEASECHRMMADWCATAHADTGADESRLLYAHRFQTTHLFHAGAWDRLFAFLDDPATLKRQMQLDPSTAVVARDLDLGRAAASREGMTTEAGLQQLHRLWKYSFMRCGMVSHADAYCEETFVALALTDQLRRAEGLLALTTSAERRVRILAAMAEAMAGDGRDGSRAAELWLRACATAERLSDETESYYSIGAILDSCLAADRRDYRDQDVARRVLQMTDSYVRGGGDSEYLVQALWLFNRSGAAVKSLFEEVGMIDWRLLDRARKFAVDESGPADERLNAFAAIGRAEILIGRHAEARDTLTRALDLARANAPDIRVLALITIAGQLRTLGDRDAAVELLREAWKCHLDTHGVVQQRGTVFGDEVRIAVALAECGEVERAKEIASQLYSGWGSVLRACVVELCRRGDWDAAMRTATVLAARDRASMEGRTGSVEISRHGQRQTERDQAFLDMAASMAASGRIDAALEVARGFEWPQVRCDAIAIVAAACARRGEEAVAKDLLAEQDRIMTERDSQSHCSTLWPLLVELAADAGELAEARRIAAAGNSPKTQSECLLRVVRATAESGRFDEAVVLSAECGKRELEAARTVLELHPGPASPGYDTLADHILALLRRDFEKEQDPEAAAKLCLAGADIEMGRGRMDSATRFLSRACDCLESVAGFQYVPTPWASVPARWARAGQLQMALSLMRRIREPYDFIHGLTAFAKHAQDTGRPDVAANMLTDAFRNALGARRPHSLEQHVAVETVKLGRLDLLEPMLQQIPAGSHYTRCAIAAALVDRGEIAWARDMISALPPYNFRGAVDPFSEPYGRLVSAFVKAGDLRQAEEMLPLVKEVEQRKKIISELAEAQSRAGRKEDAIRTLISGGESFEASHYWDRDRELRRVAAVLSTIADPDVCLRQVQHRWRSAGNREQFFAAFAWAHAVVKLWPALATEIANVMDCAESGTQAPANEKPFHAAASPGVKE